MGDPRIQDPADVLVAWEAVEDLLAAVPESLGKDALRMIAAGVPADEIADRMGLTVADLDVLTARARVRLLTAAIADRGEE